MTSAVKIPRREGAQMQERAKSSDARGVGAGGSPGPACGSLAKEGTCAGHTASWREAARHVSKHRRRQAGAEVANLRPGEAPAATPPGFLFPCRSKRSGAATLRVRQGGTREARQEQHQEAALRDGTPKHPRLYGPSVVSWLWSSGDRRRRRLPGPHLPRRPTVRSERNPIGSGSVGASRFAHRRRRRHGRVLASGGR